MNYKEPLVKAKICRIFNNMIVDVVLDDGSVSHAFCPEVDFNHQLYSVDRVVYLTKSADKRRKIPYICQMCDVGSSLVFVNYKYKNKLFLEAFHKGILDADFGRFVRVREIEADDLLKMVNFELLSDNGERAFVYVVDIFNKIGDDVVFPSSFVGYKRNAASYVQLLLEAFTILIVMFPFCNHNAASQLFEPSSGFDNVIDESNTRFFELTSVSELYMN